MNHLAELADGSFDVILASNVLHLANDLDLTLKELQRILKPQGVFLLNEAVQEQAYLNFIFGLFDGWWQARDAQRLNASPLLSQHLWLHKLTASGFKVFEADLLKQEKAQNVFCCHSRYNEAPSEQEFQRSSPLSVLRTSLFQTGGEGLHDLLAITQKISEFVISALHLPKGQHLEVDRPLAEIGLDSITGVSLVANINKTFNLSLRTAVIFDYPTLHRLATFVCAELKGVEPVVIQKQAVDLFTGELIDD